MKLAKLEAQELVWGNPPDGFENVATEIIGNSRWSIHKRQIFKNVSTSELWGVDYSTGATEYQEEEPFQYKDEVDCYPIEIVMAPKYQKKGAAQ